MYCSYTHIGELPRKHCTLQNTPIAGASDQCTGNSFAFLSPRRDSSLNNTGGAKCVAPSSAQITLSPVCHDSLSGGWTTDLLERRWARCKVRQVGLENDRDLYKKEDITLASVWRSNPGGTEASSRRGGKVRLYENVAHWIQSCSPWTIS